MMDRRAIFTPAFREFLDNQKRVTHQARTQKRFRMDGEWKYASTEWEDVVEPNYKQDVLPQTVTEEDIRMDRWPAVYYTFTLDTGRVLETFIQESRDFGSHNLTVDFMGIRDHKTHEVVEELCWGKSDIQQYLPSITGVRTDARRGLEIEEPKTV